MNASIVLKLLDGVTGPIRKVQQELANASKRMEGFSEKAEAAFKRAKNITQGAQELKEFNEKAKEFAESLVKPFEVLEQGLNRVESVSGATKEQMEQVEVAARKIGTTGRAGASEAAAAMEQMVTSGFKLNDAIGVLPTMLDRAKVANVSLAEATSEATDTAKKFGLSLNADVLTHLNDLTAKMSLASGTSFQKMNEALMSSGVAAKIAGVSVERTTQFVGLLAQKGVQGAEAGEALNLMFRNLNKANVQKIIGEASRGMVKMRDAAGNLRDPLAILTELTADMTKKGVSLGAQTTFLNTLFPRNAKNIQALMAAAKAGGLDKLNEALKNVSGTTKEMADKDLENGIDKTKKLQGAIENLQSSIGKTMAPRLDAMKDKLANVVLKISDWIEKNPGAAETIGWVATAAVGLTTALVGLTSATSAFFALKGIALMAGGWAQFGVALGGVAAFAGAAAAAIAGLGAAIFELNKNWELLTSGDAWKNYFKGIGASVMENGVASTLGQMVDPRTLMHDVAGAFSGPSGGDGANGTVNVNVKGPANASVGEGSSGLNLTTDPRAGVPMLSGG